MRKVLIGVGVVTAILLYLVLGAWLPNRRHKAVSEEYKAAAAKTEYTAETAGGEEVCYISDNMQAMEVRLAMIERARESIILSTFDFNSDHAGRQLLAALLHAADRGAEVKVIVDGLSGWRDLNGNGYFQALQNSANASIKIYNPLNPLKPWQAMCRLHDKYLIVDGGMYLLGGRNSTDLFLGDYGGDAENTDSEVLVRGTDSAARLLAYFDSVWSLPESQDYLGAGTGRGARRAKELAQLYDQLPELYPAAFEADYLDGLEMAQANRITLLANPVEAVNKPAELWYALTELMARVEDVIAYTPYVILSREMSDGLTRVAQGTEQFTMILNDVVSGANPWGCVDYLNEKGNVLATGTTVGEYLGAHSMHTKNVLIDDRLVVVGSFNFDMRSAYLDTELMLVIDSAELNAQLREKARQDLEHCRLVTAEGEVTLGAQFVAREMTADKQRFYNVLRVLIRPFRCLL